MAQFTIIVKSKDNVNLLNGVDVKAKYKDWLGGDHTEESFTDTDGSCTFNIGVSQTTIEITATKGLDIDKGTVFIDIFGNASPTTLVLHLNFNPTSSAGQAIQPVLDFFAGNIKLVLIVGTIAAVAFGVVYVNSLGKSEASKTEEKITPKEESK